ncbi:MAG: alkaline phosphatase family protein [Erysipelotrichia bacterium]|nr:alkaline phosphatase family protein [Erysipelotrichia bacterium]
MILKNDYKHCLTNLACSVQKYFGVEYKHDTLTQIDEILASNQPENVVLILFDGMGSRIIKRNLDSHDFFKKNQINELTSVFPATTTAATTSVRTGLNPVEHCWLGWDTYLSPIDKTITLFLSKEKGKEETCSEFTHMRGLLDTPCLAESIAQKGYIGHEISHFGDIDYTDLDDMLEKIKQQCAIKGKKFLYVYDTEPDSSMHKLGPDSPEVIDIIRQRNDKVEKLCAELTDTVVIVADHGHIVSKNIHIEDYPDFTQMLERTTSIETRACSFKVKEEYLNKFADKFNELFGKWFILLSKKEVLDSKLFGDGNEHPLFRDAIGDFLAVAIDRYSLLSKDNFPLYSIHAGYTDDEVYVPLIVAVCE